MSRNEKAVWNRFAMIYDRFMKRDEALYREIVYLTAPRIGPDGLVLEIATGTGMIALGLAGYARHIEAVDFSPAMIAKAQEKAERLGVTGVSFQVQDAYDLAFAPSTFDIVIIANTLHIMTRPESALSEIRRVLKPEGILIAPTFIHAVSKRAAILSRLMSVSGFRAYHRWDQSSYQHFIKENGFSIEETRVLDAVFPLAYVVAKPDKAKKEI